jgi:hypothetical protein
MWNYRVVRKQHLWRDPQTQQERITYSYGIYEAYYDQRGHVGMITQEAMEPYGETIEELRHTWMMMAEAFGQPLLEFEHIPEPGYDGEYERLAQESDMEQLEEEVDDNNDWKPTTAGEQAEYHATQEAERIHEEQRHQQEFVGIHPLKRLLDAIYNDYVTWHEQYGSGEQKA